MISIDNYMISITTNNNNNFTTTNNAGYNGSSIIYKNWGAQVYI